MPVQVYSFYIFDRHTECIYSKQWLQAASAAAAAPTTATTTTPSQPPSAAAPPGDAAPPQQQANGATADPATSKQGRPRPRRDKKADDAKLIFGTVFSLRNMVRKLGGDDDAFISFRTNQYKLHYYETPTNLRFAMLTEPAGPSMRNVLHQIYINLWVEYVIKNPLSPVEHKRGEGVRNEMFELGLDKFIRGLM